MNLKEVYNNTKILQDQGRISNSGKVVKRQIKNVETKPVKECKGCNQIFYYKAHNTLYCPLCKKKSKLKSNRIAQRKYRVKKAESKVRKVEKNGLVSSTI